MQCQRWVCSTRAAGAATPGRQRGQRAAATAARRKLQPITLDDSSDEDAGIGTKTHSGKNNGAADAGNSSSSDFETVAAQHDGSSDEDS